MTLTFPVIELIDRYTIAKLKFERTGCNKIELDFYAKEIEKLNLDVVETQMNDLLAVHSQIWELESSLKSGLEQQVPLEEIGRRAILIRDWNRRRIELKNTIANILDTDQVREFKHNHLST